jgi:hypothetical protein
MTSAGERYFKRALRLRAAMSMARLWRDQGKRDEARDLLARSMAGSAKGSIRSI